VDEAIRNGRKDCRIDDRECCPGVRGENTCGAVTVDRVRDRIGGYAAPLDGAKLTRVQEGSKLKTGTDEGEQRPGEHYPSCSSGRQFSPRGSCGRIISQRGYRAALATRLPGSIVRGWTHAAPTAKG